MNSISNGVACHHGSRLLGGGRYCSLRGGGRMVLELLRAAPNYQPVPGLILRVPGECPQGPGPSLGMVSHRVLCSSEVLPRSYLVSYSGGWLLRTGGREAEGAPEKRGCRSHLPLLCPSPSLLTRSAAAGSQMSPAPSLCLLSVLSCQG